MTAKILIIALTLSLITLLTIRMYNTFVFNKIVVHEINSPDSNIASSKIDDLINKFKIYLKITDMKVIYGETETYARINQMLYKRKKIINIPKWIMPSVGYELDYILASMWWNAKLIQKDKDIRKLQLIIKWIPIFLYLIYYLFLIISVVIFFINKDKIIEQTGSKFLMFIFNKHVTDIISLFAFLTILILIFYSNNLKIKLEEKYEQEIIGFVKNELDGYRNDITAARVFAREFNKLDFKIFRFNSKTKNMNFVGPFTLL